MNLLSLAARRPVCLLAGVTLALASPGLAQDDPPKRINVGALPAEVVDDVVIPVPTEVFGVLDKLGTPDWREVMRPLKIERVGKRPEVALLLGIVVAEGFVAVEATDSAEVKAVGRQVLLLAKAIGVEKSVLTRTSSIIDAADKKDWARVRVELDGATQDVRQAMSELNDDELAQLVSLGGWLRGTEALTQVVSRNYTKDGAELLHQPLLLEKFTRKLDTLNDRLKRNALVRKIHGGLGELKPLIDAEAIPTAAKVNRIQEITRTLVKAIAAQNPDL